MSVHTELSFAEARDYLRLHDVGELQNLEPVDAASTNTWYQLRTEQKRLLLRVSERDDFSGLVREKDVLLYLAQTGYALGFPRPVANAIGGYLTPVAPARYASLFHLVPGRALGVWEISAVHCQRVGVALAQLHLHGVAFRARRRPPLRPSRIFALAQTLSQRDVAPVAGWTQTQWRRFWQQVRRDQQSWRRDLSRRVSHTLTHGDLRPEHVRFRRGQVVGFIDFEESARAAAVLDLAACIDGWCCDREQKLVEPRLAALLRGYQSRRCLSAVEQKVLLSWLRFVALCRVVLPLWQQASPSAGRLSALRYLDHQRAARRLQLWRGMRQAEFVRRAGL